MIHCLDLGDNEIRLKETHRYADQVQLNLSVCEKTTVTLWSGQLKE